jgi:DNA recombination protein RmuC
MMWATGLAALFALVAAIFAALAFFFLHGWRATQSSLNAAEVGQLLRAEGDRIRQFTDDQARGLRAELGTRLDGGIQTIDKRTTGIGAKLDQEMARMGTEAQLNRDALRHGIEGALVQHGTFQKERLDNVTLAVGALTEKQEKSLEALRQGVETRLEAIRADSAAKLEEMRKTVDEKLQSTLDTRLGESFRLVSEQLDRVHRGIGDMQSIAANVGDLKNLG